jgi:hypothetical protein
MFWEVDPFLSWDEHWTSQKELLSITGPVGSTYSVSGPVRKLISAGPVGSSYSVTGPVRKLISTGPVRSSYSVTGLVRKS